MEDFAERIRLLYKEYENLRHMLQSATLLLFYIDLELSDLATEISRPAQDGAGTATAGNEKAARAGGGKGDL